MGQSVIYKSRLGLIETNLIYKEVNWHNAYVLMLWINQGKYSIIIGFKEILKKWDAFWLWFENDLIPSVFKFHSRKKSFQVRRRFWSTLQLRNFSKSFYNSLRIFYNIFQAPENCSRIFRKIFFRALNYSKFFSGFKISLEIKFYFEIFKELPSSPPLWLGSRCATDIELVDSLIS